MAYRSRRSRRSWRREKEDASAHYRFLGWQGFHASCQLHEAVGAHCIAFQRMRQAGGGGAGRSSGPVGL